MIKIAHIDSIRKKNNFLTISETVLLIEKGNTVYDPYSTLISKFCTIGEGNVFYPNTIINAAPEKQVTVGSYNILYNNTKFEAIEGDISIGSNNIFGEGNVTTKANTSPSKVSIHDGCRFVGNINIFGESIIENGCQIFGNITLISSILKGGKTFQHDTPDERGAVVKGIGTIHGMQVKKGFSLCLKEDGEYSLLKQSMIHKGI